MRLVEALSLGLGLPSHSLHPLLHACHTSFMRLNYYPPAGGRLCRPADDVLLGCWPVSGQCQGCRALEFVQHADKLLGVAQQAAHVFAGCW